MRSLGLLALVVGLLVATALASPFVAWAVTAALDRPFTFARVWNRVFEVLLVVGLVLAWRRLDLGGAAELGFRREAWARRLVTGLGVGLAGLAAGLCLVWLGGALVPQLRFDAAKTARKALLGLGAAIAVGAGEEGVFRGVVLRRLTRDAGRTLGVAATTAIYAAVHAVRAGGGRRGAPVYLSSGWERLGDLFDPLVAGTVWPELIGLTLFGLLLAAARLRSESLWLPIGIHAAWVAVWRVGRLFFTIGTEPRWLVGGGWPPLVGGAAAWVAVGASFLWLRRAAR